MLLLLVGSAGLVAVFPYLTVCHDTALHPSLLNVTVNVSISHLKLFTFGVSDSVFSVVSSTVPSELLVLTPSAIVTSTGSLSFHAVDSALTS